MSADKKRIREAFRLAVFTRDGHRCVMCGRNDVKLDAHHITDRNLIPNGGYVKENGISLCDADQPNGDTSCHMKAEHFSDMPLEGFHPNDLYKKISSSKDQAISAASRLK